MDRPTMMVEKIAKASGIFFMSFFSSRLLRWFKENARDLPWRGTRDPYKIWVSEAMLQQTTVATVIPYYRRWVKLFPTVRTVAAAPLHRVLSAWQGLGYYQRARNLHCAAKIICEKYAGRLPREPQELRQLPGFGPYTTAAVASIAFNRRLPLIDANVRRVMTRFLDLRKRSVVSGDGIICSFLEKSMPRKKAGDFNQALMELGALVCRPKAPRCSACPLGGRCLARARGRQALLPFAKKQSVEQEEVVAAVIGKKGEYLIRQRPQAGLWAGMWEFPFRKINGAGAAQEALADFLKEDFDMAVVSPKLMLTVRHAYTRFRATMRAFYLSAPPAPPRRLPLHYRWVPLRDLKDFPMSSAHARIVRQLFAVRRSCRAENSCIEVGI